MLPTELLAQRWKLSGSLEGIHSTGCDDARHGPEPRGQVLGAPQSQENRAHVRVGEAGRRHRWEGQGCRKQMAPAWMSS